MRVADYQKAQRARYRACDPEADFGSESARTCYVEVETPSAQARVSAKVIEEEDPKPERKGALEAMSPIALIGAISLAGFALVAGLALLLIPLSFCLWLVFAL